MGQVDKARDRDLLREVAIKHLRSELLGDAGMLRQFLWEARVTAYLDHPNIVPVHDLGQTPAGLYFVMKLVRGTTLTGMIARAHEDRRGTFGVQKRLRLFLQLCNAVSFAHARGVLHRDLKPDNVMLGEYGEVLVTDWGIAMPLPDAPDELTRIAPPATGHSAGTPMYMAPEQVRGEPLDARCDIYALGAILYEVLALRPAFVGTSLPALLDKILRGHFAPLGEVAPSGVPASLGAVVRKAMAVDRVARYPSVAALAQDVETVIDGRTPEAESASVVKQLARYYVARDPGMSKLRVVDIDLWVFSGMLMGAGVGVLLAARLAGLGWMLLVAGFAVSIPSTLRWLRLKRATTSTTEGSGGDRP